MDAEKDAVRARCTRFLTHHPPDRFAPANWFRELADGIEPGVRSDHYGEGELVADFERELADLLGKEAALFFPSGTMAQQIALRLWTERKGISRVAFHPTCHLELHEHAAYRVLHGLESTLVGSRDTLLGLSDLDSLQQPLGALLIELPQRAIGGQLPAWDELEAIAEWAKARDVALHLDGARLWETQPFYARPHAGIAAPFDSVYVSFYKILGGIAGAALAGPADFIAEARIWRRRHGGALFHFFPMVLSARAAMRERLPKIASYCEKARETAAALQQIAGVELIPNPPQTNMMHLFLRGERAKLESRALDFAREHGIWLFTSLAPTPLPTLWRFELTVGDATLQLSAREIASAFEWLVQS